MIKKNDTVNADGVSVPVDAASLSASAPETARDDRTDDFVTIWLDGEPMRARRGEPVAVALHRNGHKLLSRSLKYHRPRGAFCFEGHCGQCLMRIGGLPSIRSCMAPAAPDLECERQSGFPTTDVDVLAAANWLFPTGMDHHTLLIKAPLLHPLLHRVVRRLGGVGKLPDRPADRHGDSARTAPSAHRRVTTDLLIIGGGPAGLACGRAALTAAPSLRALVVDEQAVPGGSLLTNGTPGAQPGTDMARALVGELRNAGGELLTGTTVFGWYPEDSGGIFAAVRLPHPPAGNAVREGATDVATASEGELIEISAKAVVHATGVYAQNLLCENNDVPGVIAGRALGRMIHLHGYVPGSSFVLVGPASERMPVLQTLTRAAPHAEIFECDAVHSIHQDDPKLAVTTGSDRTLLVDTVVACQSGLPATELARSQGVAVKSWRDRFAIDCDGAGRTCVGNVYACGEVTGVGGVAASLAMGDAVGRAIVSHSPLPVGAIAE